jgi:KAP family P-loop domain
VTELIIDSPETQDQLGFGPMAQILVDVIRATPPPFTIGVFGAWGSGKTTLMNLVRNGLEAAGAADGKTIKSVWFNAWKYDGKEVIWNALIQAIFYAMKTDPDMSQNGDFLERVKKAAGRLALFAAKVGTRFIPGDVVKDEDVDSLVAVFKPLSANDEQFDFINRFEETFDKLVKEYVGADGRLVVFVDDLDRCLPDNAVAVLEAIKLYLDRTNVMFVLGVEPAVIEEGIRARYRDNPKLQAKDYLEKIVQLPFVMRGLDSQNAYRLMAPYEEASGWVGDDLMRQLVFTGTAANPRRIKRFINTYYVLSLIAELAGAKPTGDDAHRLALVLLLQMRWPEIYDELVRNPRLLQEYRETEQLGGKERDERLAKRSDLNQIFEDATLRGFLDQAKAIPVDGANLERWVLLSRGGDEAARAQS